MFVPHGRTWVFFGFVSNVLPLLPLLLTLTFLTFLNPLPAPLRQHSPHGSATLNLPPKGAFYAQLDCFRARRHPPAISSKK
jgi:hypothetical protein